MFTNILEDMRKDTDGQPVKRYIWGGLGGSWVQKLLYPWSWDTLPSGCGYICQPGSFSNPAHLGLYGGFLMKAWSIMNSISSINSVSPWRNEFFSWGMDSNRIVYWHTFIKLPAMGTYSHAYVPKARRMVTFTFFTLVGKPESSETSSYRWNAFPGPLGRTLCSDYKKTHMMAGTWRLLFA